MNTFKRKALFTAVLAGIALASSAYASDTRNYASEQTSFQNYQPYYETPVHAYVAAVNGTFRLQVPVMHAIYYWKPTDYVVRAYRVSCSTGTGTTKNWERMPPGFYTIVYTRPARASPQAVWM